MPGVTVSFQVYIELPKGRKRSGKACQNEQGILTASAHEIHPKEQSWMPHDFLKESTGRCTALKNWKRERIKEENQCRKHKIAASFLMLNCVFRANPQTPLCCTLFLHFGQYQLLKQKRPYQLLYSAAPKRKRHQLHCPRFEYPSGQRGLVYENRSFSSVLSFGGEDRVSRQLSTNFQFRQELYGQIGMSFIPYYRNTFRKQCLSINMKQKRIILSI